MDSKFAWANQTMFQPEAAIAVVALAIATLLVPRRYAFVPMLLLACLLPSRQRIVIASLDFTFLRILVLVGWTRLVLRGEARIGFNALDYALLGMVLVTAFASILRNPSGSMVIFNLGFAFDALGMYFLFRSSIRTWAEMRTLVDCLAVLSVPLAASFLVEASTGRNFFSIFGGVPEYTMIRDGRLRCQGPFEHPILAGAFWAALLPLFAARWWEKGSARAIGLVGAAMALLIVFLCASSTPLAGVGMAFVGAAFFPLRDHMRTVRWTLLGVLVLLHFLMEAPVWHLISRIDLVGGSTGWHRFHLIDQTIRRFPEWALLGVDSTAHWGHLTGDVANQYVQTAVRGGFVAFALFVAVLSFAYRDVGRLVRRHRRDRVRLVASWALGVALFTHTMMFLAVSYFGHIVMLWYLQLALIGSLVQVPERAPGHERSARRRSRRSERATPGDEADGEARLGAGLASLRARDLP